MTALVSAICCRIDEHNLPTTSRFATTPAQVTALAVPFLLAGVAIGCVETAEHAAVAALGPERVRGSAFGLLAFVQAGGNLAASTVADLLRTATSPMVAFVYLTGWMLLALTGLAASNRTVRPTT